MTLLLVEHNESLKKGHLRRIPNLSRDGHSPALKSTKTRRPSQAPGMELPRPRVRSVAVEVRKRWLRSCEREGYSAGLWQRRLVDQAVNANGDNPKDFRVRTLAEPNRRCDAIGRHQRDPGRLALHPADDQLTFMEGNHATA